MPVPPDAMGSPAITAIDLSTPRAVHIIGVGGVGMSAIALVLARMGHRITGSDLRESRLLDRLRLSGIDVVAGHAPGNVAGATDVVVVSSAIPPDNVEVAAAKERGIPVLRRAEILRAVVATRRAIAVAGSHGKTTTSSMLALILRAAGWHPTFIIGGELNEVGTNAAYDSGDWLVVEADESDGTFLELTPEVVLVTNLEADHLDYYGSFERLEHAFEDFVRQAPGLRVLGIDDTASRHLATRVSDVVTYGEHHGADYQLVHYQGHRAGCRFEVHHSGSAIGAIELPLAGRHNARNALGAATVSLELGIPFDVVGDALGTFGGVARRFQFRGERSGVSLIDDYAHLPSEVTAAIDAAAEGGWNRVIAVFQPHRYSRTAELWRDFADSFTRADLVILTEIYAAGEAARPGVSGRLLVRAVLDEHPSLPVVYLPRRSDLVTHVPRLAKTGDVVLYLGAGDLTSLPDEWPGNDGGDS